MFIAHVHKRSLQGVFNCLMSLLNGSLGSCMVGGGKTNLNIESLQDILLQVWDKRIPIVWDIYMRNSIPWSPLKKGFGAFISSGLLHEVGFQPSGSPTEDCKKEPMTFRWWKRANNIQENTCESLIRHWESSNSSLDCWDLFGHLTWVACTNKSFHILLDTWSIGLDKQIRMNWMVVIKGLALTTLFQASVY